MVQKRNSLKGLKDNLLFQRIAQENDQNAAVKGRLGATVNAKTLF